MRPGAKTRLSVCEEFSERLVTRCEKASKAVSSLRVGPLSMYLSVPLQHPSVNVTTHGRLVKTKEGRSCGRPPVSAGQPFP